MNFRLMKSSIIYLILYLIILITAYFNSNIFDIRFIISSLGASSGVFISMYIGLKLGSYRLKDKDRLKLFIERIHLSGKTIMSHICIVLFSLIVVFFSEDTNIVIDNNVRVDLSLVNKIEKRYNRKDILTIIQVGDNYIITFSDDSQEIFSFSEGMSVEAE
ncbi:hypothetical protein [Vallitalea okinawensis]|uniref:hypothetical protein n=1 Tax=Vallitalea okinawensis TaxID=2078660 RepID=UPI000CFC5B67|nr:hypothetical protein [Vallitalea okinawensis]